MADQLAHYGVPGMKWGRRRSAKKMGSKKPLSAETKRKLLIGGLAAGYVTARLGPTAARIAVTALSDASNIRKAAAGAAAANAALRGIGANPTAAMNLVGGVWKLAA